ncbi:hypothetical protein HMI55_000874 [Coelomomyces lativittatus]|nr:hypothetical protein HMI55_000874 [Coelomomyces lativittatus]
MEISSEQRYKDRIRFLETQLYDQQRNESQKLSTLHEKVLELQCQNGALLRRWDPQIKNDWEIKKRLSRFLI